MIIRSNTSKTINDNNNDNIDINMYRTNDSIIVLVMTLLVIAHYISYII